MNEGNLKQSEQIKKAMDKYDTLQKIVDQLEMGNYENEASYLNNNIAFLKLKELAKEESEKIEFRK